MWIEKTVGSLLLMLASHAGAAVDINSASAADIDSIKGIGPSTLSKIVTERNSAKFVSWPDFIERISGIGAKRAAALSHNGLTVNGEKFLPSISPHLTSAPARTAPTQPKHKSKTEHPTR